MCKKYKLQAKRPYENEFTDWCSTDNYDVVKRHIEIIESYGWQWELSTKEENEEGKSDERN